MKKTYLIIAAIASLSCVACKKNYDYDFTVKNSAAQYDINWPVAADSSTGFLIGNYWNSKGYFNGTNTSTDFGYWPQAHALDVLTDAYIRTNDAKYVPYFTNWYNGVKAKNGNTFYNEFYDDMGWNALAMLRTANATNDAKFKDAVDLVWTDIKTGWNTAQGGGIAWRKGQLYYKNVPANGPACILAARLYQQYKKQDDLDWAKKIYNWMKTTLRDPATGFVYDGINSKNDAQIDKWPFTYNQGLFIGSAVELYNITKDPAYLNDAIRTAEYSINNSAITTADRLLHDENGGDAGLFKGVFVRYFTQLILNPDLPKDNKTRYVNFLKFNAETLWYTGSNKKLGLYGTYWKTAPASAADLTTELSGCMLIEQTALLKKQGLF